jgi:hypothetical protein
MRHRKIIAITLIDALLSAFRDPNVISKHTFKQNVLLYILAPINVLTPELCLLISSLWTVNETNLCRHTRVVLRQPNVLSFFVPFPSLRHNHVVNDDTRICNYRHVRLMSHPTWSVKDNEPVKKELQKTRSTEFLAPSWCLPNSFSLRFLGLGKVEIKNLNFGKISSTRK